VAWPHPPLRGWRVRYSANEQEVFLGHSVTQQQNMSEATSQIVDNGNPPPDRRRRKTARRILTDHIADLHTIAKALLEYETLSATK